MKSFLEQNGVTILSKEEVLDINVVGNKVTSVKTNKQEKTFDVTYTVNYGKKIYIDVYLWIDNILGTANVLDVYRYTGSASDDGFISSPSGELAATSSVSEDSYRDLYKARINSPFNYTLPRRIYLGASINF